MKHAIARYNIDTSHFKTRVLLGVNHGKEIQSPTVLKKTVIQNRGYVCESCKHSDWRDFPIVLQVDHSDGDHTNNDMSNLRLLCPNCHSQTDTFGTGARAKASNKICICGNSKSPASKICASCIRKTNYQKISFISSKPPAFEENNFKKIVTESKSLREVILKLSAQNYTANYGGVKRAIAYYAVDISHFSGQSWNKNTMRDISPAAHKTTWKKLLKQERGSACEECKNTHWLGKDIPLELEHLDGNNKNNCRENLKLLCSNCHSQTKTWKRKKSSLKTNVKAQRKSSKSKTNKIKINELENGKKEVRIKTACQCGNFKNRKAKQCVQCARKKQERINWLSAPELKSLVKEIGYSAAGRQLGVTDNAIRKRLKNHSGS
jgi:5-methylcytosine-specific restriction endonuclease McrA